MCEVQGHDRVARVYVHAGFFWKVDDLSADESQHAAVVQSSAESEETKAAGEKGEGLLASAEGSAVPM